MIWGASCFPATARRPVEKRGGRGCGGGGRLAAQGARGGQGGCLFKRSRGAGARGRQARCHGTGAAGAAGPLGSLVSSRLQQRKAVQLLGSSARGWFGRPLPECSLLRVSPAGVELLRCPPQREARRRGPRERARRLQLLPGEPNFCAGFGLEAPKRARGARLGRCPRRLTLTEMTSPLWFCCFCVWAAASWPPGSALQLQPGM